MKHVFKYRLAVIEKNIHHCFSSTLDADEQKEIVNRFYKNFVDILLESIKGLSIKPEKLVSRFKIKNPELIEKHFYQNQNVIIYSQHYNNWEWGPITLGLQMKHHVVGIVKSISNKYIHDYMIKGRSKTNVSVVPTGNTYKYFSTIHSKEKPQAVFFIADQNPHSSERISQVNFFGQPTPFHNGAAIYALRSKCDIFTLDIIRKGRGHYEAQASLLSTSAESLSSDELTTRYANHLEALIIKTPEAWLWSHKRFKKIINY